MKLTVEQITALTVGKALDATVAYYLMGWTIGSGSHNTTRPQEGFQVGSLSDPSFGNGSITPPPGLAIHFDRTRMGHRDGMEYPKFSTDKKAALDVFFACLEGMGTAYLIGDMEQYGRDSTITATVADWSYMAPMAEAICKAGLLAYFDNEPLCPTTPLT